MEELITASGQKFACDFFNPFPPMGRLYLRVLNSDVSTAATVFSDPRETATLECAGMKAEQFTRFISIVSEGDAIRVVLGKE